MNITKNQTSVQKSNVETIENNFFPPNRSPLNGYTTMKNEEPSSPYASTTKVSSEWKMYSPVKNFSERSASYILPQRLFVEEQPIDPIIEAILGSFLGSHFEADKRLSEDDGTEKKYNFICSDRENESCRKEVTEAENFVKSIKLGIQKAYKRNQDSFHNIKGNNYYINLLCELMEDINSFDRTKDSLQVNQLLGNTDSWIKPEEAQEIVFMWTKRNLVVFIVSCFINNDFKFFKDDKRLFKNPQASMPAFCMLIPNQSFYEQSTDKIIQSFLKFFSGTYINIGFEPTEDGIIEKIYDSESLQEFIEKIKNSITDSYKQNKFEFVGVRNNCHHNYFHCLQQVLQWNKLLYSSQSSELAIKWPKRQWIIYYFINFIRNNFEFKEEIGDFKNEILTKFRELSRTHEECGAKIIELETELLNKKEEIVKLQDSLSSLPKKSEKTGELTTGTLDKEKDDKILNESLTKASIKIDQLNFYIKILLSILFCVVALLFILYWVVTNEGIFINDEKLL